MLRLLKYYSYYDYQRLKSCQCLTLICHIDLAEKFNGLILKFGKLSENGAKSHFNSVIFIYVKNLRIP